MQASPTTIVLERSSARERNVISVFAVDAANTDP